MRFIRKRHKKSLINSEFCKRKIGKKLKSAFCNSSVQFEAIVVIVDCGGTNCCAQRLSSVHCALCVGSAIVTRTFFDCPSKVNPLWQFHSPSSPFFWRGIGIGIKIAKCVEKEEQRRFNLPKMTIISKIVQIILVST